MRADPATAARIRRGCGLRVHRSSAPFLPCGPARVKTMGKRRDGSDHCGGELVLRHPWSSGGHPWRRRHRACLSPSFPFSSSSPVEEAATARCFRSQYGNHQEPPFSFDGSRRRRKLPGSTTPSINYFS
ncbi:Os02g0245301 [Oryza sativa Japonica Group]|uniref:Uncharacterized protein n=2 Tax=Oryza sativa subsp. japonica TaxID=39947 RepID=Q6EUD3_ORYSJ|nr:unknown protein [Oryza sativa Japonica Group]BAD27736.1 unknown protein [Oryza sativa Japonica Group]BAS77869.1 Os02g0245301 [Oryza sativa Japonica Group]